MCEPLHSKVGQSDYKVELSISDHVHCVISAEVGNSFVVVIIKLILRFSAVIDGDYYSINVVTSDSTQLSLVPPRSILHKY